MTGERLIQKESVLRAGYMVVACPCCGKDIFIPKYKPVPITEEEFRRRARNETAHQKRLAKGKSRKERTESV